MTHVNGERSIGTTVDLTTNEAEIAIGNFAVPSIAISTGDRASILSSSQISLAVTLIPVAMKVKWNSYEFWRSQILPTVRVYDLEGFLDGTKTKPKNLCEGSMEKNSIAKPAVIELKSILNFGFDAHRSTDMS